MQILKICQFIQKLNIYLSYDPAFVFTWMFIQSLLQDYWRLFSFHSRDDLLLVYWMYMPFLMNCTLYTHNSFLVTENCNANPSPAEFLIVVNLCKGTLLSKKEQTIDTQKLGCTKNIVHGLRSQTKVDLLSKLICGYLDCQCCHWLAGS
jgi:hypothetical protein